jgi:hypothetical protein
MLTQHPIRHCSILGAFGTPLKLGTYIECSKLETCLAVKIGTFCNGRERHKGEISILDSHASTLSMSSSRDRTTSKGITLLKVIEQMDELVMPTMQNDPA